VTNIIEGFDLHANVAVRAGDRFRLERLCRYVLRPPVAQDALELTPEGKVLLRLRRPWRDGTRAIRFEPSELLEKLAAMIPRPRTNLLIYHGAFAPRGCCRESQVCSSHEEIETPPTNATAAPTDLSATTDPNDAGATDNANGEGPASPRAPPEGYVRPRHHPWADLLRRAFEIDVLACPECGGRLHLVATIEQRAVIERILAHLGLPTELPSPAPAGSPNWLFGEVGTPTSQWPA
jgi:hypothetical protein